MRRKKRVLKSGNITHKGRRMSKNMADLENGRKSLIVRGETHAVYMDNPCKYSIRALQLQGTVTMITQFSKRMYKMPFSMPSQGGFLKGIKYMKTQIDPMLISLFKCWFQTKPQDIFLKNKQNSLDTNQKCWCTHLILALSTEADSCEFQVILIYKTSSMLVKVALENLSQNNKMSKKENKQNNKQANFIRYQVKASIYFCWSKAGDFKVLSVVCSTIRRP